MVAQGAVGVIQVEDPILDRSAQAGETLHRFGCEDFADVEILERGVHFRRIHFGGAEFAGGDIDVGHA